MLSGQPKGSRDTRVDVIALLKVDVLEEIAAHASRGNGIPVHVGSGQMWDRALYRHQPFAEILIDTRFHLNCHRSGILSHSSIFHYATVREASARLNYTQVSGGSEADDNIERCSGPHPALRKSSTPRMSHPTAP